MSTDSGPLSGDSSTASGLDPSLAPGDGRELRILFVSNLFPDEEQSYRGLDNATVLHALCDRHPCEVRVLSPRPSLAWRGVRDLRHRSVDAKFHPEFCRALYVPRVGSPCNHHLMRLALKARLRRLRSGFEWDLVLASWLYPDGWAVANLAAEYHTPSVLIAQGSDVHGYLSMPLRRRRILEAVALSEAVITRSRSLAVLLGGAGAMPAKLHPISNGIDTRVFCPGDRDAARRELGLPAGAMQLLFVGNFLPVKNPLMLIQAFERMRQALPTTDLRLTMVGDGPLRMEVASLAASMGISEWITFTGPLAAPKVAKWMQAADVFCMTSANEGLPNVILEAQACGLPVISTDVGGIHELVDEPAKGVLVPSGDIEAWIESATRMIVDPPDGDAISRQGMTRDWGQTADAYWRVLLKAARSC